MSEVETKKYTITGLVDFTDEQGNIVGQLEVGSVQELPVDVGDKAVAEGRAEVFEGEEEVDAPAGDDTTTADPSDAPGADDDNADLDDDESDEDESDEDEDDVIDEDDAVDTDDDDK